MRLLRKIGPFKYTIETFNHSPPPYAILSHTWESASQEPSFQEIQQDGWVDQKAGFNKIIHCAEKAAEHGLEYFWVDTCCIDKSSSEELFEAINSMFAYYSKATVCFAYLSDVVGNTSGQHALHPSFSALKNSRWFKRGWTLQELIAPAKVFFYSRDWECFGTKETLNDQISDITGISSRALNGADLRLFSVSERMSWASSRETSRPEDIAYSLMGVFDIQMTLFYGEGGERSFIRLQEEIIKTIDDQSIFAWKDRSLLPEVYSGLLARSPKYFSESKDIHPLDIWGRGTHPSVTSKGLHVSLFMIPYLKDQEIFRASLDCCFGQFFHNSPGIYLKCISGNANIKDYGSSHHFARIRAGRIDELNASDKSYGSYGTIYIKQHHGVSQTLASNLTTGLHIFQINAGITAGRLKLIDPPGSWNEQTRIATLMVADGRFLSLYFEHNLWIYTVFAGVFREGVSWTRIKYHGKSKDLQRRRSELINKDSPWENWNSYNVTGIESHDHQVTIGANEHLPSIVTSNARVTEIGKKLVYVISVAKILKRS